MTLFISFYSIQVNIWVFWCNFASKNTEVVGNINYCEKYNFLGSCMMVYLVISIWNSFCTALSKWIITIILAEKFIQFVRGLKYIGFLQKYFMVIYFIKCLINLIFLQIFSSDSHKWCQAWIYSSPTTAAYNIKNLWARHVQELFSRNCLCSSYVSRKKVKSSQLMRKNA